LRHRYILIGMATPTYKIYFCLRCQHEWPSRRNHPLICPKCKTPYWNTPKGSHTKKAGTEAGKEQGQ